MTQVLTAFSLEPDNVEKAVEDILGQLDLEHKLLKNTVGLLFGYVDFINSGVVKALCAKLPFDVLGGTSQGLVLHQAAEEVMLTLMVLTSNEAEFSVALSRPLTPQNDTEACIVELYRQAAASLKGTPSLMFLFPPLSPAALLGRTLDALNHESGGIPFFGAVAVDMATKIRTPLSIFNGEAWEDRIPLLLISGIREFKFFLMALPRQSLLHQEAVITAAEDNRIIDLDKKPAIDYLRKVGLIQGEGSLDILYAFPLEVNFCDGKPPRIFAIYNINPDGSITCGGPVPVGSTVYIGSTNSGMVLETASHITSLIKDEWVKHKDYGGLLIFSCFSRNMALADPTDEMVAIQNHLKDFPLPYIFLYAGGEYCPLYTENGLTVNGFHQYTITACLF
ncbi:MAG: FIST C-terminal domain-containing protein [Treponema sp.]|jgi:hypothetical protein|nr:FIST C-terminal domain-containing protein [Treponema sp.]